MIGASDKLPEITRGCLSVNTEKNPSTHEIPGVVQRVALNYHEVASLFRAQRDTDTLNSVSPARDSASRTIQTQRVEWLVSHFNGGASESAGDDRNCPGFSSPRHRSVLLIFNERNPAEGGSRVQRSRATLFPFLA